MVINVAIIGFDPSPYAELCHASAAEMAAISCASWISRPWLNVLRENPRETMGFHPKNKRVSIQKQHDTHISRAIGIINSI